MENPKKIEIIPEGDPLMKTIRAGSVIEEIGTGFKLVIEDVLRKTEEDIDGVPCEVKGKTVEGTKIQINFGRLGVDWRNYKVVSL